MKVGTADKKVKRIQGFIREHAQIKATLKYMESDVTITEKEVLKYKENLKKQIIDIESWFDKLLK